MSRNCIIFLFCVVIAACTSSKTNKNADHSETTEAEKSPKPICFNHAVLVLDSVTYYAALNSEFVKQFAFSEERQMSGYKGFYLFGKTNYLEFFHPKSFVGYEEEEGGIWICLASLRANYIAHLNKQKLNFVEYTVDEHYRDLSLILNDSINPIATWEMTQKHYESWTKKVYHDTITFLPVDYNSPQDADSSSNYAMQDLLGIGLALNTADSSKVLHYLKGVGFESCSEINGRTRISNKDQFFELHFIEGLGSPKIEKYFIRLNRSVEPTTEIIGNSKIMVDEKLAIWQFY